MSIAAFKMEKMMTMGHLLLVQVHNEVLLALELVGELGCMHHGEGSLLRLGDLVGFHR